jgi:chemotaxis protein histidine kinase CheA
MNTKERFPISSHEVTNSRSESFDYKKYGIEPIVKSNSLDGDNFSTPHEWTPAGRAEKVNDARDAVAIAFGDKPPALARQESNTGRQLLVGEAYKAATDGGAAPTNERASTRRVLMTGEKITGKLPSHADAERGPQSVDEMLNRRADLLAKGVPEDLVDGIVRGEHNKDRGDNLVQYASRPPIEQAAYEQPAIREESNELVSHETSASAVMSEAEETPLSLHAEIPKAETAAAKLSSEPEPKTSKENTPPKTVRNESPKVETTETKPATSNRTAEKNPAEQVAQPAEDKTSPLEQSDSNQENTLESEADVSKTGEKQAAGEQNTTKPGERQQRANKWAGDFLRAYSGFLDQNVRAELADRLKSKGGLNVDAKTLQAMSRLAKEAGPRSPIWQVMPGSGSTIRRAADEARSRLQSIVESL